ncbi:hypothetical protein MKZ38_006461 [Zalerion maritima]|uniref:Uncharacterized protein n=1 Tax=Zalerion maritima TaxID=339359 RepID=A0AAD5RVL7_9PEZI|nr:hypothetical protein MKZ38_006461 [Zalerion maritima]
MKFFSSTLFATICAVILAASQTVHADDPPQAVDIILAIMPDSATCNGKTAECTTAADAAPYLIQGFQIYQVSHAAEIGAILATVGTESVDLAFRTNQSPGRPGQGSSNMQLYENNLEFARSNKNLTEGLNRIEGVSENPTDDIKNAVRELVIADPFNFWTGPWFYSTHCTDAQKAAFTKKGATEQELDDAFSDYSLSCVGVETTADGRMERWTEAKKAFGLSE